MAYSTVTIVIEAGFCAGRFSATDSTGKMRRNPFRPIC